MVICTECRTVYEEQSGMIIIEDCPECGNENTESLKEGEQNVVLSSM